MLQFMHVPGFIHSKVTHNGLCACVLAYAVRKCSAYPAKCTLLHVFLKFIIGCFMVRLDYHREPARESFLWSDTVYAYPYTYKVRCCDSPSSLSVAEISEILNQSAYVRIPRCTTCIKGEGGGGDVQSQNTNMYGCLVQPDYIMYNVQFAGFVWST